MGKREPKIVYTSDGNPGSVLITAEAVQERSYDMHAYPNVSLPSDDPIDLYIAVPSDWGSGKHFADWYRNTVEDGTEKLFDEAEDDDGSIYQVIDFGGTLVHVILPM